MLLIDFSKKIDTNEGIVRLEIQTAIEDKSIVAITGDSGAGKTTLLRILAGLSKADQGFISYHKEVWLDTANKINLPIQKRNIGFVFQENNLFPHMSIRQNLDFALAEKNKALVDELLQITELAGLADAKPAKLSGGQKQKAALARAFLKKPHLLLLDEPLNALDLKSREKLQDLILVFHQRLNTTILLVSHDKAEIQRLADRILLIEEGRIKEDKKKSDLSLN